MTPEDPLQSLHPLREPPAVGWWPPAPGWWLLAALLLALLIAFIAWAWRRHRRDRYRRQAVGELVALRSTNLSGSERVQRANEVLKRTALAAYPDRSVAALSGSNWILFLDSTLPGKQQVFADIDSNILYTPEPSQDRVDAFTQAALSWARHHRRGAGHA